MKDARDQRRTGCKTPGGAVSLADSAASGECPSRTSERAIELFQESISAGKWPNVAQSQNWFGLTIAQKQFGRESDVRDSLAKGQSLLLLAQPFETGGESK